MAVAEGVVGCHDPKYIRVVDEGPAGVGEWVAFFIYKLINLYIISNSFISLSGAHVKM